MILLRDKKNSATKPDFEYDISAGLIGYRDMSRVTSTLDYSVPDPVYTSLTNPLRFGGRRDVLYRYYTAINVASTLTDGENQNYSLGNQFVDNGSRDGSLTDEDEGLRSRRRQNNYTTGFTSSNSRILGSLTLTASDRDNIDAGFVYPSEMLMVINQNAPEAALVDGDYKRDTKYSIGHFHANRQDDTVNVLTDNEAQFTRLHQGRFNLDEAELPLPYSTTGFDAIPDATYSVDDVTLQNDVLNDEDNKINYATADSGDIESFGLVDDVKELLLPYAKMSNMVTTRSDVFTAYITLQGRKYAGEMRDGNGIMRKIWKPVITKRFLVVYDRSNVFNPGDKPRVIMKIEIK